MSYRLDKLIFSTVKMGMSANPKCQECNNITKALFTVGTGKAIYDVFYCNPCDRTYIIRQVHVVKLSGTIQLDTE